MIGGDLLELQGKVQLLSDRVHELEQRERERSQVRRAQGWWIQKEGDSFDSVMTMMQFTHGCSPRCLASSASPPFP